ncbi:hypothetical protein B7P43_G13621 [Cryptotermes secundus]|uniref:Macroglobulin domain-containing protein n=4 Tax=Cryptotermes secundus TaxID=105785 RepID=A0A2J7RPN8_9NEOP|nr:hypothetical protein B7P43_G13621 [Cryptotermes secundus]
MCISVLFLINALMLQMTWGEFVSQESKDVPPFRSEYSASSSGAGPCYLIVAPKVIRPTTLYGVTITILDTLRIDYPFISVKIEIRKDETEITSVTQNIPVSSTQTLFMQIPSSSTAGHYMLRIEGNYPHTSRGTVFKNETEIVFSPRFLSIVIQTSRPVYKAGQVVRFRVVLLTTELKPFEDSVNVYVLNSDGLIMRRWVSMQINNGVISHKFTLPQLVNDGFWKIRVEALDQTEDQIIRVENYFSPLFEV